MLDLPSGSRVLDLGCAFGYGTQRLARCYRVVGRDLDAGYIDRARHRLPGVDLSCGPAESLPYPDHSFDGVVMLDVLEHVIDEEPVLREVARTLRPGGTLVLSVPHQGILAQLDSLNLYRALVGADPPFPTEDPSWPASPHHRHYSLEGLRTILGDNFQVEAVRFSGIGLAEIINLVLLMTVRRALGSARWYSILQYVYFAGYVIEDQLSIGSLSYHVMLRCRRRPTAS